MRPVRLAHVALEAEALRLRQQIQRAVVRCALAAVALSLAIIALVFLHIAAWYWLRTELPRPVIALMFAGFDLVLAIVLSLCAIRLKPGRIEREALALRRRALDDAAASLSMSALFARLVALLMTAWR